MRPSQILRSGGGGELGKHGKFLGEWGNLGLRDLNEFNAMTCLIWELDRATAKTIDNLYCNDPKHRRVSTPTHSAPTVNALLPVFSTPPSLTRGDDSATKFSTSPLL
ncbi:hypothetical protein WAI453_005787 [Rhynchosporium graminicola]